MFPNLEKDVIDDVVRMKEGRFDFRRFHIKNKSLLLSHRVGLAVDACLALNA